MLPTETNSSESSLNLELNSFVERARRGDTTVLPRIRALMDAHPEIATNVGNTAQMAEEAWINALGRGNAVRAEVARREANALRTSLLSSNPSVLERLHVDQVVICRLQLTVLQQAATQLSDSPSADESATRRAALAQRSYLAAIKGLAEIQKLLTGKPRFSHLKVASVSSENG